MTQTKMCPECGRAMERNIEENKWECVHCGCEVPIFYGRSDDY